VSHVLHEKAQLSALEANKWWCFFVMTSPAFKNSRSLDTEVAGAASILHASARNVAWLPPAQ